MKKTIRGTRYDTNTSIVIGEYTNLGVAADNAADLHFCAATLYRTARSGNYFLAGMGGPLSRFAQAKGQNSWERGRDIIPLSRHEAFQFARMYFHQELVEAEFGDLIKDT